MDSFNNIMCLTDSYKTSHYRLYPPGTERIYSYLESRGGKFPNTVFFGLQYIIKRYLTGAVVTEEKISEAKCVINAHMGSEIFNEPAWRYILENHNGRLPVRIKAVPEGTIVPGKNVLVTIENTDPECFWLSNYLETLIVEVWYPITVCTNSYYQKRLIGAYLSETSETIDGLEFKLHDFGFRGASSVESAALGGCAHLVNFKGTDTMAALLMGRQFYSCDMAGFSIPATEHSTITAWTKERERDAYENVLKQYPSGLVACVSDSYDVFNACSSIWGGDLKKMVEARPGGCLVIRPDSGDPCEVLPRVLNILGEKFGFRFNTKNFKVLPSCVSIIQGDGISYDSLDGILNSIKQSGWSTQNVSFGSGGALLQRMDRDTMQFAFKCSFAIVQGQGVDVYKDPVTDHAKQSKKGRLTLERDAVSGQMHTLQNGKGRSSVDLLQTVFENGELLIAQSLSQIRTRVQQQTDFSKFEIQSRVQA